MQEFATAIAVTLLTWWFSTGAILYLDGLPRWTFRWSMAAASLLAAAALFAVHRLGADTTPQAAYGGFIAAILLWGFVEIAFLLGLVTGSWRRECPPDMNRLERFLIGVRAVNHHEILLLGVFAAILAASWAQPNQTALWTFAVLWFMRLSTKLNIFLGVPNITVEFLPDHLVYLKSFFRHRAMNALFPFSVTAGTVMTIILGLAAAQAEPGSHAAISFTLLSTLTALGVIEHWFLVVPLDVGQLWSWGLRSHAHASGAENLAAAPVRDGFAGPADGVSCVDATTSRPSVNWTQPVPCAVAKP